MAEQGDQGHPWTTWAEAGAARAWTVGIEEEVMLLDPGDWSVTDRVDDVLVNLSDDVAASVSRETHEGVLELRTAPHASIAGARPHGRRQTMRIGHQCPMSPRSTAIRRRPLHC